MGTILYNIFITPLEMFIEIVFNVMNRLFNNPGFAIIFVSLAVQLLCLPLYKRADAIQEQDRIKQEEMKPWLEHIKKTFHGDERFMMQQAYYRIENYKPIYAIKGSISLLLQIPFFMAAYNYLSHLEILKGASFIGIADLSSPDGLVHLGSVSINLLPVLMTFFNIISGIIYTKGFPIRDKIQTYGLACVFLVLLYRSPSGLVFYWTLNNLFSLLKNVFMKVIKNPQKVIRIFLMIIGSVLPVYVIFLGGYGNFMKASSLLIALICFAPHIVFETKKHEKIYTFIEEKLLKTETDMKTVNAVFYCSLAVLFILPGIVIPISTIKASPVEFISQSYGPFGLILNTISIFIGFIFVWLNIFYLLSSPKIKRVFSLFSAIGAGCFGITYFAFGKKNGIISTSFIFDSLSWLPSNQRWLNLLAIVFVAAVVFGAYKFKPKWVKGLYQIISVSLVVLAVIGVVSIEKTLAENGHPEKNKATISDEEIEPIFHLSTKGQNVIVFMLDRAINGYVPYIMEENPQIKSDFDGFTYYPNTLSYAGNTLFASASLYGGYEYTPTEINKRDSESLCEKQNEALTVMPRLFSDNGYNVVVTDPPYAGYTWTPDLSIYDGYDNIKAYKTDGVYVGSNTEYSAFFESVQKRNIVMYSIMMCMPTATQKLIYQGGSYWGSSGANSTSSTSKFYDNYSFLDKLSTLTEITDDDTGNFIMISNDATHDPILLKEPEYEPSLNVECPTYTQKTLSTGETVTFGSEQSIAHYQANVCSLKELGQWFEYMKANNVYDNTRIIVVSDHGRSLGQFENMELDNGIDVQEYNPLLLVKNFNAEGFAESDEFMTNADVPTIASTGVVKNSVNPFTGKALDGSQKNSGGQIITTSSNFDISQNKGNVFNTSDGEWWSVSGNIFNSNNWKKVN